MSKLTREIDIISGNTVLIEKKGAADMRGGSDD